jgi:hypothetical protein
MQNCCYKAHYWLLDLLIQFFNWSSFLWKMIPKVFIAFLWHLYLSITYYLMHHLFGLIIVILEMFVEVSYGHLVLYHFSLSTFHIIDGCWGELWAPWDSKMICCMISNYECVTHFFLLWPLILWMLLCKCDGHMVFWNLKCFKVY